MQAEYPAAPLEPKHPTCCNGHDVNYKDEIFACQHKACSKDELCIGCVWECCDCGESFCEEHIIIRDVTDAGRYSEHLCRTCDLDRRQPRLTLERFHRVAANSTPAPGMKEVA
jgi:hypothetical protein